MKVRRCGELALLVEVETIEAVHDLHTALTESPPAGVVELVPAARTLLVYFDPHVVDSSTLSRQLERTEPAGNPDSAIGDLVILPVVYDETDLVETADACGLSVDEVIAAHTAPDYRVAFSGFVPGFAYLLGTDPRLRLPRRSAARHDIPAGSVAVAGEFTGIYPRSATGTWHVLGRTETTGWHPGDPGEFSRPGTRVRFERVPELPEPAMRPVADGRTFGTANSRGSVEVKRPGELTTVQDLGRPGHAARGVGRSGAADRPSAALANRLVGNSDSAPCLESTFGGLSLLFHSGARVAVTGAPCALSRNGHGEMMNSSFNMAAGQALTLGAPTAGVRTYVAVRGGFAIPPTFESRSTDVFSGLGPPALSVGDILPIGHEQCGPAPPARFRAPVPAPAGIELIVRILLGPREDWFDPDALRLLTGSTYVVTSASSRAGIRLDGPTLHSDQGCLELPSEPAVAGAVQVQPSGLPTVLLTDHPVTDGFPVVAVVAAADLPVVAQARPGQRLRFRTLT